jgi:hypothetical protein
MCNLWADAFDWDTMVPYTHTRSLMGYYGESYDVPTDWQIKMAMDHGTRGRKSPPDPRRRGEVQHAPMSQQPIRDSRMLRCRYIYNELGGAILIVPDHIRYRLSLDCVISVLAVIQVSCKLREVAA